MSLFNLFKKPTIVNQKSKDLINHFLNSQNLDTVQKTAIIYFLEIINNARLESKENKYKDYHDEFFKTTISLAGFNLNGYYQSINIFKSSEFIFNNAIEYMNTNQKVIIVILFQIFISYCEHNGEDLTDFKDTLMQVYKSIDPNVNLYEIAFTQLTSYIKTSS